MYHYSHGEIIMKKIQHTPEEKARLVLEVFKGKRP